MNYNGGKLALGINIQAPLGLGLGGGRQPEGSLKAGRGLL